MLVVVISTEIGEQLKGRRCSNRGDPSLKASDVVSVDLRGWSRASPEKVKPIECDSQAAAKQGLVLVTDLHSLVPTGKVVILRSVFRSTVFDCQASKSQQYFYRWLCYLKSS